MNNHTILTRALAVDPNAVEIIGQDRRGRSDLSTTTFVVNIPNRIVTTLVGTYRGKGLPDGGARSLSFFKRLIKWEAWP